MFDKATWRARLSEMRGILEKDRSLLLSGQIEKLSRQDGRRRTIEAKLHEMPLAIAKSEVKKIDQLRRLAARNHRLLKAYLDGARRAAQRLITIEEDQGRIGAYRRDGSRVPAASAVSTKQQRA